jgi:hypothetical protein
MLGVYDSGMGYGTTDAYWEKALWSPTGDRRLEGLPINFYLNYWYGSASATAMHSLMGNLARRGIMYVQTGNCFNTAPADDEFAINGSDEYVRDIGGDANLGGYYTIDECVAAMVPGAFAQYERLRVLDPDSVTFAALMGNPPDVVLWRDAADLLSTDPYPLYAAEPAGGYRHNDVARWTAQTREAVKDARPFATVLQFFKFTTQGRWPTREEMRNHAYMAIVEGAKGLWWWSVGENALKAVCSGWCDEKTARLNDLKAVVSEIAALESVLLADDAPAREVASSHPGIRTRVKRHGSIAWLFAYNDTAAPVTTTFTWSTPPGRVTVYAEQRTIPAAGDAFSDSFGPYQAHVYAVPLVSIHLAADRVPPQAPGTPVHFTADVTGAGASPEFQWWLHDGTTWTIAQGWSTSRTFTWTPTLANAASSIGVWVRTASTTVEPDAVDSMPFPVLRPVAKLTSLTADRSAPQPPGTAITFTALATAGVAPLQYRWWLHDGNAWTLAREWSTSNTFTWTPSVASPNASVGVWVRSANSTGEPDVTRGLPFPIVHAPLTLSALVSDRPSPQPPGTLITFTAQASGGVAPLEYRWWLHDGKSWNVAREWSASNTFTWTPGVANPKAAVGVWVRGATSNGEFETAIGLPFPIVRPPVILNAIVASKPAPQAPGTAITFTASASGGVAPLEYRWWLYDGGSWKLAREWSTSQTFMWTPSVANPYAAVGVWVRSAGASAEFDVTRGLAFPVMNAP